MRKIKLAILRVMFITLFSVAYAATGKLRYRWICRYLSGRGGAVRVPRHVVEESCSAIARAIADTKKTWRFNRHCLSSSVIYDGAGFWGRPELFYLCGGFTFFTEKDDYSNLHRVVATDVYDWNPIIHDDGSEHWHTSAAPKILVQAAAMLFGQEWFPVVGYPMGNPGISNKLWFDLMEVGAKPFTSIIREMISLPVSEGTKYNSSFKQWEREIVPAVIEEEERRSREYVPSKWEVMAEELGY